MLTRSGVRTHADIRPLELKSNALTTQPSWLNFSHGNFLANQPRDLTMLTRNAESRLEIRLETFISTRIVKSYIQNFLKYYKINKTSSNRTEIKMYQKSFKKCKNATR